MFARDLLASLLRTEMPPFGQAVRIKVPTLSHVFISDVIKADTWKQIACAACRLLKLSAGTFVLIGL
jgi:hypothetical protein